jgi:hypothetical protein
MIFTEDICSPINLESSEQKELQPLPVDYLTQLVRGIHAGGKQPELMVILKSYFDDSGRENSYPRVAIVGGYVGRFDQIEKLQEDWGLIFKRDGVKCFHMADYENSQGEYKGWSDNEQAKTKRKRHLETLIRVLNLRALHYIGCGVMLDDFESVCDKLSASDRRKIGGPKAFCFLLCLLALRKWIDSSSEYSSDSPDVFYEHGPKMCSEIINIYSNGQTIPCLTDEFKFNEIIPLNKSYIGMQPADLIAYEAYKVVANPIIRPEKPHRESLKRILNKSASGQIYDASGIEKFIDALRRHKIMESAE